MKATGLIILLGGLMTGLRAGAVTIDTTSLPTGAVAEAYSGTLTASGGTGPYAWNVRVDYDESIVTNEFPEATQQQVSWTNDASAWQLDLPFTFPLYGVGYTQCWVSSEAYITFGATSYLDETPSRADLETNRMVAAGWKNLETHHEVYVLTNGTQCIVRWVGYTEMAGYVNVAVELNESGLVRVNLGNDGDMMSQRVCGISSGNGTDFLVSTNANGILDPGNYIQFEPQDGLPELLYLSGNQITGIPADTGTVDVVFVAQDSTGVITNKTLELSIEENTNEKPVVDSSSPVGGAFAMDAGTNQTFSVSASDPESEPLSYAWTWDGAAVGGSVTSYTHSSDWTDEGEHTLRANIHDDFWTNGEVSVTWNVTIRSDNDGDDMPNSWERLYGLDPNTANASLDTDDDGLTHLQEYQNGCNPTNSDTDGDSLIDGWEVDYSTNPTNVTEAVPGYTNFVWQEQMSLVAPTRGVFLRGTNLFAACAGGGLEVFNVANPHQIELLDLAEISRGIGYEEGSRGTAFDLTVAGDTAYLCVDEEALQVWDVSDPSAVVKLGEYKDEDPFYRRVQVVGTRAYLASHAELKVLDVSDPANITLLGSIRVSSTNGSFRIYDLEVKGDYAYCANYTEGLKTVDISDPSNMSILATNEFENVGICEYAARGVDISGDTLLMVQDGYGLMSFDISGGIPVLITNHVPAGVAFPYDTLTDVSADGTLACVVGVTNLWTVDFSNPSNLVVQGVWTNGNGAYMNYVSSTGSLACVSMGLEGFRMIDISSPAAPAERGEYKTSGTPRDMEVLSDRAYIANGDAGLYIIDVSVPTNWVRVGRFDTDGDAWGVDVSDAGNTVCMADGSNGVLVLDTTDPSNITVRSHYDTSGFAGGAAYVNNRVYVADDASLLVLTNLDALAVETNFPVSAGSALDVDTYGSMVLVAVGGAGLNIYEYDDKAGGGWKIDEINYGSDIGSSIYGLRVDGGGGYAWVADYDRGGIAVDVLADPPAYAGRYDPTVYGQSVYYANDYLWLGTSDGLTSVHMGDPSTPRAAVSFGESASGDRAVRGSWVSGTNGLMIANDPWHNESWFLYGFDVNRIDSDADGLEDGWEMDHFGDLDQNRDSDYDEDGLTEWGERLLDLDPDDSDYDNDRLMDGDEDDNGTDPTVFDTDGDGMSDGDEVHSGSNPLSDGSIFGMRPLAQHSLFDEFVVTWYSFDGHTYNLYRRSSLVGTNGWTQIVTNAPATPPVNTYTDTVFSVFSYFYRVESVDE